jgi:hypothetical protein
VGDYLLADRTSAKLEHCIVQVVSKAERMPLSATDKEKLFATFVKGSASTFKATWAIIGLEDLPSCSCDSSFRNPLQMSLCKTVFLILKFYTDGTHP